MTDPINDDTATDGGEDSTEETTAAADGAGQQPEGQQESEKDYRTLYQETLTEKRRWERRAKDHAREAKTYRDKARKWDEAEAANQTEAEHNQARAEEAETRAKTALNSAIRAEIRAAAHGWAKPHDAPRYVDDWSRYVDEDGEIDTDAIAADVGAVLDERPYLASRAEPEARRGPSPDPGQGARGGVSIADQIRHAENQGDYREALRLKTEQLLGRNRQS